MTGAPFAPWDLRGESLVTLSRPRPPGAMPDGIRAAPGPCAIGATRYTDSPVGPYLQLTVAVPARLGARLGWCVVLMVVDRQDARTGARLNWGYPAELGALGWSADGEERELTWVDRGIVVRGRARGPKVPMVLPRRDLQHRGDGPVLVPGRVGGLWRLAAVAVEVPPEDPLAVLAGRHPGAHIGGVHRVVREARTPIGLLAPLRAPTASTEPLLTGRRQPAHARRETQAAR